MNIGTPGIFRVPETHHTKKPVKKGDKEELVHDGGSIQHAGMHAFAGIVGRVHPAHTDADGKKQPLRVDVAFLVPGRPHFEWVFGIEIGEEHGEFEPEFAEKD